MGLFNFFNRSKSNGFNGLNTLNTPANGTDIPEHVFVEKDKLEDGSTQAAYNGNADYGINILFRFLEVNYEAKGYDDALVNPDNTHLEQNLNSLRNDLSRNITKVKLFYADFIREIDVHLATRRRTGMIDVVEELEAKKQTAESHILKVLEIENDSEKKQGIGEGIIFSYTRGFRNGLAAISHHSILRKTF